MSSLCPHIADAQQPVRPKLALYRESPVLNVRLDKFGFERSGIKRDLKRRFGVEVAGKREDVEVLRPAIRIVEITGVKLNQETEGRLRVHVGEQTQLGSVVENAVATANAGGSVALDIPGEAEAGTKVVEIRLGASLGHSES